MCLELFIKKAINESAWLDVTYHLLEMEVIHYHLLEMVYDVQLQKIISNLYCFKTKSFSRNLFASKDLQV